jgi:hypothetical protein
MAKISSVNGSRTSGKWEDNVPPQTVQFSIMISLAVWNKIISHHRGTEVTEKSDLKRNMAVCFVVTKQTASLQPVPGKTYNKPNVSFSL